MIIYTKDDLIHALKDIRARGWIPNARPGNAGGVGNTLEDLLGIRENNLPMPNAAEWEIKAQRAGTSALTTLFHMEPSPRALRLVPSMLLPQYGWQHEHAGVEYPADEMSFRQTLHGQAYSDRGFRVIVNREARKVLISFDASSVAPRHVGWLSQVRDRVGLAELNPQPYWGFDDLRHKAGTKLLNTFYVQADVKREGAREYFHYNRIWILRGFNFEAFLTAIELGDLLVDFDARSGHNHGTKFRLRQAARPRLYSDIEEL